MSVVPKKALGQHFLVDENLLGVIGRLAELEPSDVVLEIGPGLGVLTRYLAERVALVHAMELDRALEPPLREALAGARTSGCVFGDALEGRPRVARAVADEARRESALQHRDADDRRDPRGRTLELWCVMVQREVADRSSPARRQGLRRRLGARPADGAPDGLPPGLTHGLPAAAERRLGARCVPAGSRPPRLRDVRRVVEAAFSHRRKTLANALQLAGVATRAQAADALAAIGRRPDVRAEELEPPSSWR